jgi:hypothetical protein
MLNNIEFALLSKSEQSFLLKRIEKALKKWKRKQVKKSKHKVDFSQFNLKASPD